MADSKASGRPTTYNDEILVKTQEYIQGGYVKDKQLIPSVAGLSIVLGVGRQTIYDWASYEGNEEFSYTLELLGSTQECKLLNGGLGGEFNPTITKLALGNHGYSENKSGGEDGAAPPIEYHFHVADAIGTVKTTNARA